MGVNVPVVAGLVFVWGEGGGGGGGGGEEEAEPPACCCNHLHTSITSPVNFGHLSGFLLHTSE